MKSLSLSQLIAICWVPLFTLSCTEKPAAPAPAPQQSAMPQKAEKLNSSSDWPLHGGTENENRYSPLSQINKANVAELGLAWEYNDFLVRGRTHRGVEATPLIRGRTMYFSGPWSVVYAVDAVTGKEKWLYDPEVQGEWARRACCDAVNRGVALLQDSIFVGTLDGYLVSIDAKTGDEIWRTDTLIDRTKSYTITGAPRIAGDLVIIGNGGAELGVRGYVSAYHADSGTLAWRFYTVPGAGPDEHSELTQARDSWGQETRFDLGGGGTVWDSMTYDSELGLLYVGVGNGSPWPKWTRDPEGGDNLFLSSILAIEAKSGMLKWHYQTTPGDSWDYTATQNLILTELEIQGKNRKVLMQAPKNGFFYVLDRETGELLKADKYTTVTWASHVDLKTGRPVISDSALYADGSKIVWPGTPGGHNWQSMAFNPDNELVYIPVLEMPQKFALAPSTPPLPHTINVKANVGAPPFAENDPALPKNAPLPSMRSYMKAWNPKTSSVVWQSEDLGWWSGGVLTTAGDLVFQGGSDGIFRAFDANTGEVLLKADIGTAIMAPPVTYQIDGVQYIAVAAGYGGAQLPRFLPGMAARKYENYERMLVFKLDGGTIKKPPTKVKPTLFPLYTEQQFEPEEVATGLKLYRQYCGRCHSPMSRPSGYPDLWNLPPSTHDAFQQIVGDGIYAASGMAGFSDALSEEDISAIQSFIIDSQQKMRARE